MELLLSSTFAIQESERRLGLSRNSSYPLTGLLGGLLSSTSVALTLARLSHSPQGDARQLVVFFRSTVSVPFMPAW
jgi:hypothetical protein